MAKELNILRLLDEANPYGLFCAIHEDRPRGDYSFLYLDLNKEVVEQIFKSHDYLEKHEYLAQLSLKFRDMYVVSESKLNHEMIKNMELGRCEFLSNGVDGLSFNKNDNFLQIRDTQIQITKHHIYASCFCKDTKEFIESIYFDVSALKMLYKEIEGVSA